MIVRSETKTPKTDEHPHACCDVGESPCQCLPSVVTVKAAKEISVYRCVGSTLPRNLAAMTKSNARGVRIWNNNVSIDVPHDGVVTIDTEHEKPSNCAVH